MDDYTWVDAVLILVSDLITEAAPGGDDESV
jgi:hypothetical protein